jgi:hypothetical protein
MVSFWGTVEPQYALLYKIIQQRRNFGPDLGEGEKKFSDYFNKKKQLRKRKI